jgi:hypothetical protein
MNPANPDSFALKKLNFLDQADRESGPPGAALSNSHEV